MSALPTWPASRLGEALEALARAGGLASNLTGIANPPPTARLEQWIETAAAGMGLEAEPTEIPYPEIERCLRTAGPALLQLPDSTFLVLLDGGAVQGPGHVRRRVKPGAVRAAICSDIEGKAAAEAGRFLEEAGVPRRRRERTRAAILRQWLASERFTKCWVLRRPPGVNFWRQLRQSGLPSRMLALAGAHALQYVLWILAWWVVGEGALQGRLDRAWLLAWALLLLTLVPLRVATTWLQGLVAITGGGLLKQRLLYGALRLEPDEIRHQGAGQLLGQVIESEAVESLALSGGFLALVSVIELVFAAAVLGLGAGGGVHVLLLLLWIVVSVLLGWRYFRANQRWTATRLTMTHDLVERLVGHRTRLAQEARERWHEGEDRALESYLDISSSMDRALARLTALAPRGWLILGVLGLAPAFVSGAGSPAALAVGVGGILLAYRAFKRLAQGLWNAAEAVIAWRQVAPLFHAAARPVVHGSPALALTRGDGNPTLIEAHDLVFRYGGRADPVLRGCSLRVSAGDRLLLEGPSGGGKSTLASLLTGLRVPQSGLLLVRGLDRQTLGSDAWRQFVAAAPQFHENHVLTGPFAFNLLMGRRGLLGEKDLEEAETVCNELGLGELLRRMPAGLLQLVGETGWQLSHGERSRLYIARALLQESDVVVLDESFAALDPENLRLAIQCVLKRAATLLVIAHR